MASKKWLDNAFWETEEKNQLNCILEIVDDEEYNRFQGDRESNRL